MIGNPTLGKIVGADLSTAITAADLAGARGVALGFLLGLYFVEKPSSENF